MDEITPEWLRLRLKGARGGQASLAAALGIGPDKVSKMLSGERRPQSNEIPKIFQYFDQLEGGVGAEFKSVWPELNQKERELILLLAKELISLRLNSGD